MGLEACWTSNWGVDFESFVPVFCGNVDGNDLKRRVHARLTNVWSLPLITLAELFRRLVVEATQLPSSRHGALQSFRAQWPAFPAAICIESNKTRPRKPNQVSEPSYNLLLIRLTFCKACCLHQPFRCSSSMHQRSSKSDENEQQICAMLCNAFEQ